MFKPVLEPCSFRIDEKITMQKSIFYMILKEKCHIDFLSILLKSKFDEKKMQGVICGVKRILY